MRNTPQKKRRVTFAHDEPERLCKPKPIMVAVYVVNSPQLILSVKTAQQIEEEAIAEMAEFRHRIKKSTKAWKPRRARLDSLDDEDDLEDAIWELLKNASILNEDGEYTPPTLDGHGYEAYENGVHEVVPWIMNIAPPHAG